MSEQRLHIHTGPFLRSDVTTPRIMRDVVLALVPLVALSTWTFGLAAPLVIGAATLGAVGTEWLTARPRSTLGDWSAALTGVVLGLTLPPALPLWMALLGGVVAIGLGKAVWGGLGQNLFNPALVGRAFLQAAFPIAITTWTAPGGGWTLPSTTLAVPLMHAPIDAVSAATPLNLMKFEGQIEVTSAMLSGSTAGSLGETGAVLIAAVGLWLAWRRAFDWRIPVGILATVAALSAVAHLVDPTLPGALFMLSNGGLMLGAVFMATDPVTSPTSPRAVAVFAFGVGVLVVLIRLWGGLPEGVMYAILLMNAATPLLERALQPRPFGRGGRTP